MTAPTATTGSERGRSGATTEQWTEEPRIGLLAKAWRSVSAAFGALLGLLPHLLHHTGLIFGAALVTGTGGNLLFGALGLFFSLPLLRRLYIRFRTWKAPAIALVIFVAMFSLSAFVIGPAISGGSSGETPPPGQTPDHSGHAGH
ncbi:MAG: hypothetical protein ABIQ15_02440 [Nocardioides sp.]